MKQKNSVTRNSARKFKSAAAATMKTTTTTTTGRKKSKTTPHFKSNIEKRHQEALKAGFQNAEEYKTFLKQKEATRIAETTMI